MVTGRKLLLADDSVTIQKVVDLTFTDEGLEVVTASDGQQALEKLDEDVFDIVLADVFMPRLNGYEVCEYIKRTERLRHIPVMLLVGSFEPFDEAEARRVGADDYLTKPFQSIRTLIGKVRNLLAGGGSRDADEATTRRLVPPPEAEKENRAASTDFLERSTADTAPLPDVHEDEASNIPSREVSFADLSMDDEMIETTPASDYASAGHSNQPRATAQYTASDLREAGISQAATENAPAPETVGAYAPAQTGEQSHASVNQSPSATRPSNVASSDDALLDLGDIEPPPAAMSEADDFFLDLLDDAPPPSRASASSWSEAQTPSYESAPTAASSAPTAEKQASAAYNSEAAAATSTEPQAQEFVDAEVVEEESAPVEAMPVEATPATDYASETQYQAPPEFSAETEAAQTERLPDDYQVEGTARSVAATETVPEQAESATPRTGQITLDQLSPEAIDAIARRAVELLSERVVEQIAWEVVPDLAERLIKRRLEEENKQ